MAGGTTVTIGFVSRDGTKVTVAGSCGTTLASKPSYFYVLKYKIGSAGSYQTLISQVYPSGGNPDISTSTTWTYTVDVGTLDSVYFQFSITDFNSITYTGTTPAILGVSYDKKSKTSRSSNIRTGDGCIARSSTTRNQYPNR